jgi:hypothetical protein
MKFALCTAFVICIAGCKHDAPCKRMMDPSPLLQQAAVLRLDVYDASAHCMGATLEPGAPPPIASRSAANGQPLKLDVPTGHHVLLLSAFSDDAATVLLGSACAEGDFSAGDSACFNLTVEETPDAAVAPPDQGPPPDFARPHCNPSPDDCGPGTYCASDGTCASGCKNSSDCSAPQAKCDTTKHICVECLSPNDCPLGKRCSPSGACVDGCDVSAGSLCPGAQMCCSNLCLDTTQDLSSCGACGRACSSTGVVTPSCAGSVCKPQCSTGLLDCNHPIAPDPDDGCETNGNDVNHCGACSNVCNLANATAACPASSCTIASCSGGFFDCNAQANDGCECAGVDLGDGMKGCCAGGCQATHNDGYAHAFNDCTPFGTYSLQLAKDAATAYNLPGATDNFVDTGNDYYCVRKRTSPPMPRTLECVCWAFAGPAAGYTKHVLAECMSPTNADVSWK